VHPPAVIAAAHVTELRTAVGMMRDEDKHQRRGTNYDADDDLEGAR
jgi:hypothetical protein